MSQPVTSTAPQTGAPASPRLPEPGTVVLLNRPLRPGTDPARLSRWSDTRWDFAPGVFEEHHPAVSVGFDGCPARYEATARTYLWVLVNTSQPIPLRRAGGTTRLTLLTISAVTRKLFTFFDYLDTRGITQLQDVAGADYDGYLDQVRAADVSLSVKEDLITEVRRLWSYRGQLPPGDALPDVPPWDGEDTQQLVGRRTGSAENSTRRIPEQVMAPLLLCCLRYVDDFSADIIAAWEEYKLLARRNPGRRHERARRTPQPGRLTPVAQQWLEALRARGDGLPGKRDKDSGELRIDWAHASRVLDCQVYSPDLDAHKLIEGSGLPIDDGAALEAPITACLDGQPWLPRRIRYREAEGHARRLATACFIVISYLSGMRVGETLSLQRGCVTHDPDAGLWLLHGTTWKDAKDADGNKIPQGVLREQPWVVIDVVARAVAILERLHDSALLIPCLLDEGRYPTTTRAGKGRLPAHINRDLGDFARYVNAYCAERGRSDLIPPDPSGRPLSGNRFRRTLAWHIYRRPRGLVAGAIQYGHVRTQVFLGYAGNYASGFPDDAAMEEFLVRLEEVADDVAALDRGEHVSGPAADRYRSRVRASHARFAGRVLQTTQAARAMIANPALQVFPGHGVTCVFDARKALCEAPRQGDIRRTPTLSDCRSTCGNIARTDRDIAELRGDITTVSRIVADPLSPPIRHRREAQRLASLQQIIDQHEATRPPPGGSEPAEKQ